MSVVEKEVKKMREAIEKGVPVTSDALELLRNLAEQAYNAGIDDSIESVRELQKQVREYRRQNNI